MNIGLLVLVNLLWSTQFVAFKLVAQDVGPITVSFLVFLIATPLILPFYLVERWRGSGAYRALSGSDRSLRRWDNAVGFLVIGILGVAPSFIFTAWGMARTTASNGALLSLTIPVMTALLAAMILRERMTAVRWLSLAVALLGVFVLSIQAPESATKEGLAIDWQNLALFSKDTFVGNLLILIACLTSSLYNVCSKGLLSRFSALEVLLASYVLGLAATAVLLVGIEPLSLAALAAYSAGTWAGLLLLGAISFGAAMVLWMFLLTRMDVAQASVSVYLLPFFGVLLAAIFLHERITLPTIIGGAITLAGTILIVSFPDPPSPKGSTNGLSKTREGLV
jgi:drug/metabolite transporter (DMT)-like permease